MIADYCIFCFRHRDDSASMCSYGLRHEFPSSPEPQASAAKPVRVDTQVCLVCKLHAKNPKSLSNDCKHEYPT